MRTLQKAPDKPDSLSEPPPAKAAPLPQKPDGFRSIFADVAFRSLVMGVPGRVVRAVSADDVRRTHAIAAHYLELAQRYAHGSFPPPWASEGDWARALRNGFLRARVGSDSSEENPLSMPAEPY